MFFLGFMDKIYFSFFLIIKDQKQKYVSENFMGTI